MNRLFTKPLCLILIFGSNLHSQHLNQGPRFTALGNSGVALHDVWSLQSNQAGIAFIEKPLISISYLSNYFNPDLSTQSAALIYPFRSNAVGLSFQNYGFSVYSEQKIGFSYAKCFGETFSVSLAGNIHQLKIETYGSSRTLSVEIGFMYLLNERLTLGTHIRNPTRSQFDSLIEAELPVDIEMGTAYRISDKAILHSAIVKTLSSNYDLNLGVEYNLIEYLALRGGVSINPLRQYLGIGYQLNSFSIDAAASSHPQLGFSPQLALGYEF